jgi:hypothetical protein
MEVEQKEEEQKEEKAPVVADWAIAVLTALLTQ